MDKKKKNVKNLNKKVADSDYLYKPSKKSSSTFNEERKALNYFHASSTNPSKKKNKVEVCDSDSSSSDASDSTPLNRRIVFGDNNRKEAKQSVGKGKKVLVPSTIDSKGIRDDKLTKSIRMKEITDEMKKVTKDIEARSATLQIMKPSNTKTYYFDTKEELESYEKQAKMMKPSSTLADPSVIERKEKEFEADKVKLEKLDKEYFKLNTQKELMKGGRVRKLRKDEIVNPTSEPVYKWFQERKR